MISLTDLFHPSPAPHFKILCILYTTMFLSFIDNWLVVVNRRCEHH